MTCRQGGYLIFPLMTPSLQKSMNLELKIKGEGIYCVSCKLLYEPIFNVCFKIFEKITFNITVFLCLFNFIIYIYIYMFL